MGVETLSLCRGGSLAPPLPPTPPLRFNMQARGKPPRTSIFPRHDRNSKWVLTRRDPRSDRQRRDDPPSLRTVPIIHLIGGEDLIDIAAAGARDVRRGPDAVADGAEHGEVRAAAQAADVGVEAAGVVRGLGAGVVVVRDQRGGQPVRAARQEVAVPRRGGDAEVGGAGGGGRRRAAGARGRGGHGASLPVLGVVL